MGNERTAHIIALDFPHSVGLGKTGSLIPQEAAAIGMSFEQLIEKLIDMAWKRR